MSLLNQIIDHKKAEVGRRKELIPIKLLERSIYFDTACVSLKKYLLRTDLTGVMAEFKRKSPSGGFLNKYADAEKITLGYMQAGASALSVLTDTFFFGGHEEDLRIARKYNFCPILCKDFVIDAYQILEAKSIGADVVLLIAAVLSKEQIKGFTKLANDLGMEVLLELHAEEELEKLLPEIDLIGINNRNLKTMQDSIENSFDLVRKLPSGTVRISESGICKPEQLLSLKEAGFNGFLMGTLFMKEANPSEACRKFCKEVSLLGALKKTYEK